MIQINQNQLEKPETKDYITKDKRVINLNGQSLNKHLNGGSISEEVYNELEGLLENANASSNKEDQNCGADFLEGLNELKNRQLREPTFDNILNNQID